MIFALLILSFFLGIFLIVKNLQNGYQQQKQQQNLPPGPWGLPFLGHLISLGVKPHLTLIKWKQKYGPIISCRFGSFPTVVLSHSKMIKEAYNMNEFSGRPKFQAFQETNVHKGVAFSDGPYNTQLRRFAIRKLKEFGMGRKTLENKIHDGVSEFMDFIKKREGLPIKSEDVPSAHIIKTLWSIMMTGEETDSEKMELLSHLLSKTVETGSFVAEIARFMPWMEKVVRALSLGRVSLIAVKVKVLQDVCALVSNLVEQKKRNWARGQSQGQIQGQGQAPVDIMEMFFEKVAETTDQSSAFHASRLALMTEGAAMYFLTDFLSGGIHTMHTTLVWLVNFMAKNPEVQLKLEEEIDQVIGNGNGNDLSRLPSLADRGQMPYADGVVNEVLRMSSVLPLLLPHYTTKDVRFHGYTIK